MAQRHGGTPAPGAGSHAEEVVVRVDHHRVRELPVSPAAAAAPLAAGVAEGPAQQAPLTTKLTPAPPSTARASQEARVLKWRACVSGAPHGGAPSASRAA